MDDKGVAKAEKRADNSSAPTTEAKEMLDVMVLHINCAGTTEAEHINDILRRNKDAAIVVIWKDDSKIDSNISSQFSNTEWTMKQWFSDETSEAQCYFRKDLKHSSHHTDYVFNVKLANRQANLMLVHVPNGNGNDVKTAKSEIKEQWHKIAGQGPAIACGTFNLKPNEIRNLLGSGICAFKEDQLWESVSKSVGNACANYYCELVGFFGEKVDDVQRIAFAVRYVCHNQEGEFYGKFSWNGTLYAGISSD